jgi:hypothetical protein
MIEAVNQQAEDGKVHVGGRALPPSQLLGQDEYQHNDQQQA